MPIKRGNLPSYSLSKKELALWGKNKNDGKRWYGLTRGQWLALDKMVREKMRVGYSFYLAVRRVCQRWWWLKEGSVYLGLKKRIWNHQVVGQYRDVIIWKNVVVVFVKKYGIEIVERRGVENKIWVKMWDKKNHKIG